MNFVPRQAIGGVEANNTLAHRPFLALQPFYFVQGKRMEEALNQRGYRHIALDGDPQHVPVGFVVQ